MRAGCRARALAPAALALAGLWPAPAAQARQPERVAVRECVPVPALMLRPDFPTGRFTAGSPEHRALVRSFREAWRRSCAAGLQRGMAWTRLYLRNAPAANVAQIYVDPEAQGWLILEAPFVTEAGVARPPEAADLAEAIYCHVRGATPREQEEDGRCLPD
ncbi:MAG TPA: hypothetical protein VMG08_17935 [Allosphingosinicella sp.]|nr:hypothetical protein [Allosphingosinicella sp.]